MHCGHLARDSSKTENLRNRFATVIMFAGQSANEEPHARAKPGRGGITTSNKEIIDA
jgi:hypothetical protein